MKLYSLILFFLTLLGIFVLAHLAIKHLRASMIYRQLCKSLILLSFRLRGKILTESEIEEELEKMVNEMTKGE